MRATLDDDLLALLSGTDDQRRVIGQALVGLHRALVLWRGRGKSIHAVVRGWAPGAAQLVDRLGVRVRRRGGSNRDQGLRRFLAPILSRLAIAIEGGDSAYIPFVRELEARFPALTKLLRDPARDAHLDDPDLASRLTRMLGLLSRTTRSDAADLLRREAAVLAESHPGRALGRDT